jgi:hypothetical protein
MRFSSVSAALFQQSPQADELGFRLIGPLAFRVCPLTFGVRSLVRAT